MLVRYSFIKDAGGSVGLLFGLIVLVVVAAVGIAVDYGRAVTTRMALQAATDAAAAAAAASPSDADAIAIATNVFKANYTGSPEPQLNVTVTGDNVTVTAATSIRTSLMGVTGVEDLGVAVSTEAEPYATPLCILLLEKTQTGLDVSSGAMLDASECGIHINSANATEALSVTSNANITAADVCVVGGSKVNGTVTPAPTHGCAEKGDPMVSLPEPPEAAMPCKYSDFKVNNGQTRTMSPGVYCKQTLIDNHGRAIMEPGDYVFREGEFVINANAIVTGSDVMMFFQDKVARLNVNSNSTVKLTARKSGTYEGVLMFQSRHPDTLSAPPHIFNSNSNTQLEGAIYIPNGILELNSNAAANVLADYTLIIARRLESNSNGTLQVRSDFSGNTPRPPMLARFNTTPSARLVR